MKVEMVELRRIAMPLVRPFRTSFGTQTARDILLVRVVTDVGEGWGECVALADPVYSSEYVAGAQQVLRQYLVPQVVAAPLGSARQLASRVSAVIGHRMAKAALETALLDAELRAASLSLAAYLGGVRDRVDCGVSVGIAPSVPELVDEVRGYVEQGYRRIKLKVEPGWDLEPMAAVRAEFGDDLLLQVDANTAYTTTDLRHLARFDDLGLLLIEQPFAEEDIEAHVRLAATIATPVCLDESVVSAASAADAIRRGACSVVNVKAGRVGGYLEAARVHDVCAALGVPVWCGGMLETGLGRAANVALASLPGFTLPGDTSASSRFYREDITEPFVLEDGRLPVPQGPGIGGLPLPEVLDRVTTSREELRA
ncbi:o-succinylbenzoate synthase [Geodermatophilus sp. CPCC 206100]|uniref:o-succinylbenzoate synthase n=1 Tax=Geodermatophilus sp. CPCC 206100 TaxID=3020054 RepID=UPI003B00F07F